jgi:hypothetical protein
MGELMGEEELLDGNSWELTKKLMEELMEELLDGNS